MMIRINDILPFAIAETTNISPQILSPPAHFPQLRQEKSQSSPNFILLLLITLW